MTRFLCISVTFLLDRFHGRTAGDRAAEWPPSPLRLFQALVAAAHRGRGEAALPEVEEIALRWLGGLCERCAPTIIADGWKTAEPYVIAVPNNDMDDWARAIAAGREPKKQPAELKTMKIVRPTAVLDPIDEAETDATVRFLWPLDATEATENGEPFKSIRRLTRQIIALGWGTDLVAADARILDPHETVELRGIRWQPGNSEGGSVSDRPIPKAGTLHALRARHTRWLKRVNPSKKQFDRVPLYIDLDDVEAPRLLRAYKPESAIPPRPFAAFALRHTDNPDKFRAFRCENAAKVAAMLRHAACAKAKADSSHEFPGGSAPFVAGHGPRKSNGRYVDEDWPRFSYMVLPTVGHAHADGMIRRVLIAEPFGGDGSHVEWAAGRLNGAPLIDEDSHAEVATLERLDQNDNVLRRFTAASRNWTSASPVVLPGYDGLDMKKAAKLFSRACDQAGLPPGSVESFEFIGPPRASGSGRPFLPNYLRGLPLRWAVIRFRAEVSGPIAIGAGRHCGLGIFVTDQS